MKVSFDFHFEDLLFARSVKEPIRSYLQDLEKDKPQFLYQHVIESVEPSLLKIIMKQANYSQPQAAKKLGITLHALNKKLIFYGLLSQ